MISEPGNLDGHSRLDGNQGCKSPGQASEQQQEQGGVVGLCRGLKGMMLASTAAPRRVCCDSGTPGGARNRAIACRAPLSHILWHLSLLPRLGRLGK